MQIVLLYVSTSQLIVILCYNYPLMLLNVNTYANSDIESSFALMKFTEVVMYICRIVSTVDANECIFCVNEQQQVKLVNHLRTDVEARAYCNESSKMLWLMPSKALLRFKRTTAVVFCGQLPLKSP